MPLEGFKDVKLDKSDFGLLDISKTALDNFLEA